MGYESAAMDADDDDIQKQCYDSVGTAVQMYEGCWILLSEASGWVLQKIPLLAGGAFGLSAVHGAEATAFAGASQTAQVNAAKWSAAAADSVSGPVAWPTQSVSLHMRERASKLALYKYLN